MNKRLAIHKYAILFFNESLHREISSADWLGIAKDSSTTSLKIRSIGSDFSLAIEELNYQIKITLKCTTHTVVGYVAISFVVFHDTLKFRD